MDAGAEAAPPSVGTIAGPLEVGPIAHGGHCVCRWNGMVVFVRNAIPGEVVKVRITGVQSRFARGEVFEVIEASPLRRAAPCPIAATCGGCDFQHLLPEDSRELKRQVVAELVAHHAGYEVTARVEAPDSDGFGWRTRMRYHRDAEGRLGLRAHRSNDVVALPERGCLIAAASIARPGTVPGGGDVLAVAAASATVIGQRGSLPRTVTEQVGSRTFEVAADGFWQSHAEAPRVLTDAVLQALRPAAGETAFDLFCGVGLFAGALVDAGCTVLGIEGDTVATALARRNVPEGRFYAGDVAATLRRLPERCDIVVLDPPRAGAGKAVMAAVAARRPRAVAYVACDPAALARDLATARDLGYRLDDLRIFDLYGTTHHVECVALLTNSRDAG